MSGKVIEFMKQPKYRFDFGTDDRLYTVIFNREIPQWEIKKMMESVQNSSYANMAEAIEAYLAQHHMKYSNPVSFDIPVEKNDAMNWANHLLHSETYEKLDENIENADVFYSVMDYQSITPEGGCEGCYFAMSRLALGHKKYKYNIITQTLSSDKHGFEEHGYFAIRESDGNGNLQDIAREKEDIPFTFGCVDMMGLLLNIETIKTKEEAVRTAIK